ncbi:MAG: deoxyguanosinetriphosphate triphosphohydrolase, partial [bacterium]
RDYLYYRVYYNSQTDSEFAKALKIIRELYSYYLDHPSLLPGSLIRDDLIKENIHRAVCDYIAGMTDRYALCLYRELFFPKPWTIV